MAKFADIVVVSCKGRQFAADRSGKMSVWKVSVVVIVGLILLSSNAATVNANSATCAGCTLVKSFSFFRFAFFIWLIPIVHSDR